MAKPNDGKRISLKMFGNEFQIFTMTTTTTCIRFDVYKKRIWDNTRETRSIAVIRWAKVNIIKHLHTKCIQQQQQQQQCEQTRSLAHTHQPNLISMLETKPIHLKFNKFRQQINHTTVSNLRDACLNCTFNNFTNIWMTFRKVLKKCALRLLR